MAIDAVASGPGGPSPRVNPRPVYEGQPYYSFDDVVESVSFWDILDIFNPLQHIPLVNVVYRKITGDEIGGFAQVAGGALYGGPVGAGLGIASMVLREATGNGPAELVLAAFSGSRDGPSPGGGALADGVALAEATTAPLGGDLLAAMPAGGEPDRVSLASAGSQDVTTSDRGNRTAAGATAAGWPARDGTPSAPALPLASGVSLTPFGVTQSAATPGQTLPGQPVAVPGPAAVWRGMASAPLGAGLLATGAGLLTDGAPPGAMALSGVGGATLSLDRVQGAALASFVAQHNAAARADSGSGRGATGGAALAALDGIPRGGVPPTAQMGSDQQGQNGQSDQQGPGQHTGQDMNQHANRDQTRDPAPDLAARRADQPDGAVGASPGISTGEDDDGGLPMPADIRAGRANLRARMAETASVPTGGTDGPTGMTLADYRANPNRKAEDDGTRDASRSNRRDPGAGSAVNAGSALTVAGMLPDAATMAGLLQRGERVTAAVDSRARGVAEGAGGAMSVAGRSFRALPVGEGDGSGARGGNGRPVANQPWFSQQVMDAMRKYDALRTGGGDGSATAMAGASPS